MSDKPYAEPLQVLHALEIMSSALMMANVYPKGSINVEVDYTVSPQKVSARWVDAPTGREVVATLASGGVHMKWAD